jgi:hypothetical protein
MARGMVSKFQPCLPESAEDRLLAERLVDLAGTLRFVGSVRLGSRVASGAAGLRLRDEAESNQLTLKVPRAVDGVAGPTNPIQWVDTPAALRAVAASLATEEVIGLDVETTLDFNALCLVQVAVRRRTYLIDPLAIADLGALAPVFGATTPRKVIHNASFERRVLAAVGLTLDGVVDTLELSRRLRGVDALGGHSLAMVGERELGVMLDKSEQTSNWGQRPLSAAQMRYAALDAEVLLPLQDRLTTA